MIPIVSGLPRSGTSLMMQMLDAGGLPVLADGERKPDPDNPKGYLEGERFMQRPLPEVLKSQDEMLRRRGNADLVGDNSTVEEFFHRHLIEVNQWLARHANIKVTRVHYHRVLREPKAVAEEVAVFLQVPLDIGAMVGQVDGNLYRNRMK